MLFLANQTIGYFGLTTELRDEKSSDESGDTCDKETILLNNKDIREILLVLKTINGKVVYRRTHPSIRNGTPTVIFFDALTCGCRGEARSPVDNIDFSKKLERSQKFEIKTRLLSAHYFRSTLNTDQPIASPARIFATKDYIKRLVSCSVFRLPIAD